MRPPASDRLPLIALLALNALLKFAWLGVNDLSGDEPFTLFWATRPMEDLFVMLRTENNPPLYFLLIKAWTVFIPLEDVWLRMPSAFFSVLTIWPLFLLARTLGGRPTAVVACLLFTLNNHQYAFAHELRTYPLLLLLSTLAGWLVVRGPKGSTRWSTLLLGAVFALLVWTHFFGWLVLGLLGICVMVLPELHEARRRVLVATLIAAAAFLPYSLIFVQRAGESIAQGTWVKPHGIEEMWHMVRRWGNQPVVTLILLLPVALVLFRDRLSAFALRFAMIWWLVPLVGLWCVQWWVPAYVDRYLLFASTGFYIASGYAISGLVREGWPRWALPVAAVAAMAFTFTPWKDNGQYPSRVAAQVRAWQHGPADPPVIVRPFWYKFTLWAQLDRSRDAYTPWLQTWTERYDDMVDPTPIEQREEVILISMAADTDDGPTPTPDGFRQDTAVRCDALMRVARFSR